MIQVNDYSLRAIHHIINGLGYQQKQLEIVGKIYSLEDEQDLVAIVQTDLRDRTSDGKEATITVNEPRELRLKVELQRKACEQPETLTQLLGEALCRRGLKPGYGYSLEEKGNCTYALRLDYEILGPITPLNISVTFEPTQFIPEEHTFL